MKLRSPANICLFKVNNRNTKKKCELYSQVKKKNLGRKNPERRHIDFKQLNVSWEWFCNRHIWIVNLSH